MEFSDMSLVAYLGSLQLPDQRMSLSAIQEPLFALYSKHVKLGQLSRLQERHLAISRAGITMRWKANERGPPESCELNIPLENLIYSNAVNFQTISAEAYSNEMKLKKSKKKKECYCAFQPIGNVDRYNSSLFTELKKPFTYLYGQAYCPMLFVFVSSSLQLHAIVCHGEQQETIHKVRVCDNLKRSMEEGQDVYQSSNNGVDSPSSTYDHQQRQQQQHQHQQHQHQQQVDYGAAGIYARDAREQRSSSAVFRTDLDSTYQNNTRLRENRPAREREERRGASNGRQRDESPYYERRLPSPDVVPEEQVYRKLPINKVLPTAFLPNVALREVPKDRNGNLSPSAVSPTSLKSSSNATFGHSPSLLRPTPQSHQNRAQSYPSPTSHRLYTQQQTSLPSGVPQPPTGPAPKAPTVYSSHAPNYDDYDTRHDEVKPVIMKGTKDEEIVSSFSGIDLSAANKSFDMNNLHEALGYLP